MKLVIIRSSIACLGEKSPETIALRKKISDGCEQQIWEFFKTGQVVIYDANNGTRATRQTLAEKFHDKGIHVIMLGGRQPHLTAQIIS
jgi:6-phosphofructo-2-kinase/fructose-2,6-biphosphatase 4